MLRAASAVLRVCLVTVAMAALSSCAMNDHFNGQVARLDRSVESARDELVVTNIVRAAKEMPLNFVTVPTVHATNATTSAFGLPTITFGPQQTPLQKQFIFGGAGGTGANNAVGFSGSTSFDVNVLESKDFYRGMLNPVSPEAIRFFTAQGISREILFYLFIGKVTRFERGRRTVAINDPTDPTFPAFRKYVQLALRYGLVSEPVPGKKSASRVCFEPELAHASLAGLAPICGHNRPTGLDPDQVSYPSRTGPVKLEISARSPLEVYQYLGHIVAAGPAGAIQLANTNPVGAGAGVDDVLFRLDQGTTTNCSISVAYGNSTYCVPAEGAPNTTRIIGLLVQLDALATTLNELSLTQNVRITP